ncbi:hypothetical protein NXW08_14010 [Bacteroides uniformis]|uniref:hypothetical protein n=1 Tax=Bacteroides uniformis TaxID=820 RepID=UPI002164FB5D|nr:hypothetical protein [Bacteroides uniformis]MCS2724485.1 hypothetical protein [Bacteroides uniformis]
MSQEAYTNESIHPLFSKKIMKKLFEYKGVIFYASEIVENTIKYMQSLPNIMALAQFVKE